MQENQALCVRLYLLREGSSLDKVREGVSEWWDVSEHSADNSRSSKEHRIFPVRTVHTYLLPSHSPTLCRCRCSFEERQVINRVLGNFPPFGTPLPSLLMHSTHTILYTVSHYI